jgi:hypothetical protein
MKVVSLERRHEQLRDPQYGVNRTQAYVCQDVPVGSYWRGDFALRKLWTLALSGPVVIEEASSGELMTVRVRVKNLPGIEFGYSAPQAGRRQWELSELLRIMEANGVRTVLH